MNSQQFEQLREQLNDYCSTVMGVKGEAYSHESTGGDRLANFKRNAAANGITPAQCLMVYLGKHYDAVQSWVRE